MSYSEYEHRHNFFIWAAARAAQRGFTNVEMLRDALEQSRIEEFVKSGELKGSFDENHKLWCASICDYLNEKGIQNVSYGRAAKLVNVYLKGMVVIGDLQSELARIIHPPIDRILLKNLSKNGNFDRKMKDKFKSSNWTQLNEVEYFELVDSFRLFIKNEPFWKIEEFWTVTNE
jgi:hypothetical protein